MTTTESQPGLAGAGAASQRRTAAGRMLAILDAFGPTHRTLSLSEISRRADLTLPTAHRLVGELVSWGALERDATGRYLIGLRLLELSALAPRGLELREAAFPYLDDLHRVTRGNVHLGVRDGHEVVYVETLRSRATAPVSSRVGDRWPLHATGTGLVLLAYADHDVQESVLRGPLIRYTDRTIVDPRELRSTLATVRHTGMAVAHDQITMDAVAVAVPVCRPLGNVVAAISVVVSTEQAEPRELTSVLTCAAHAISRALDPRPARTVVGTVNSVSRRP
jgi:DNA-binding IclR family transcriptional regulator